MKIVLIGANGQVGSEVALLLHGMPGIELVCISRTRNGSAFLRSRGIPVRHGSVSDSAQARTMLEGADLVASFALAIGLGRAAIDANHAILQSIVDHADPRARLVFFSTHSVHGNWGPNGEHLRTAYGDLKRRNERYFARAVARSGHSGFILRLGHVCGDEQNISHLIREEIASGEVVLDDPERASNTTHVVAIAEALLAIAEDRTGPPGLYDCVNDPQWSWREVYAMEASRIGLPLEIRQVESGRGESQPLVRRLIAVVLSAVDRLGVRATFERLLPLFTKSFVARVKANHSIKATRQEIAALAPVRRATNSASWWPGLETRNLPGLRSTRSLIDQRVFVADRPRAPWPPDPT